MIFVQVSCEINEKKEVGDFLAPLQTPPGETTAAEAPSYLVQSKISPDEIFKRHSNYTCSQLLTCHLVVGG